MHYLLRRFNAVVTFSVCVVSLSLTTEFVSAQEPGRTILPGEVIYSFDTNTNGCNPDEWNFFGSPTTDFGADKTVEDGNGAFHSGDWTLQGGPFLGHGVGIGPFPPGQPLCPPTGSGTCDINLDLTQGTGITMRVRLELPPGDFPPATQGTAGVRMQFELVDSNGLSEFVCPAFGEAPSDPPGDTVAVVPWNVQDHPWVDRRFEPGDQEEWETVTIYFDQLDAGFDDGAVAGLDGILELDKISAIRVLWWPGDETQFINTLQFDDIRLIDDMPVLWGDTEGDGDIDLLSYAEFQICAGETELTEPCRHFDADTDGDIDADDLNNLSDCLLGPFANSDFFPWCY
ncbi:MAG: hypothetical protein DHS20C16_28560 [Phycisphaerae bacterium]|nr:MAG: hypothetical protein DHS20C16_28560 [Phycisphaerae bacterium]